MTLGLMIRLWPFSLVKRNNLKEITRHTKGLRAHSKIISHYFERTHFGGTPIRGWEEGKFIKWGRD
jgi:hypothetical protein